MLNKLLIMFLLSRLCHTLYRQFQLSVHIVKYLFICTEGARSPRRERHRGLFKCRQRHTSMLTARYLYADSVITPCRHAHGGISLCRQCHVSIQRVWYIDICN